MARKKKERIVQKFGEMRYGQWFQECRDNGTPRVFIKIQNILPSGIQVLHLAKVARDHSYPDGTPMAKAGEYINSYYNAIDIDGIPGCCPDWLEFELIDPPFKQRHNHDQGRNLKLPRYDGDRQAD